MADKRENPFQTLVYDGNAVRQMGVPQRLPEEENLHRAPRVPQEDLERGRESTGQKIALREQQKVSLLAIAGFVMVAMLAVAVLTSHVQLNNIYARTVAAQSTLTQLESDYAKLETQDQEIFDNARLNKVAAEAGLVKPGMNQQVYVELSDPDNAVVYRQDDGAGVVERAVQGLRSVFSGVGEYFN
jgi:cell division protein FtsL